MDKLDLVSREIVFFVVFGGHAGYNGNEFCRSLSVSKLQHLQCLQDRGLAVLEGPNVWLGGIHLFNI